MSEPSDGETRRESWNPNVLTRWPRSPNRKKENEQLEHHRDKHRIDHRWESEMKAEPHDYPNNDVNDHVEGRHLKHQPTLIS
jgi:hypothetical protein